MRDLKDMQVGDLILIMYYNLDTEKTRTRSWLILDVRPSREIKLGDFLVLQRSDPPFSMDGPGYISRDTIERSCYGHYLHDNAERYHSYRICDGEAELLGNG